VINIRYHVHVVQIKTDNVKNAGSNKRGVDNSRSELLYRLARLGSRIRPTTFLKLVEYYVQKYNVI